MTLYGLGTKSASALGLASIALEAHDMGKRCARRGKAQASADKFEIGRASCRERV